ncbi:MAG TPA: thiamine phosphate synthase, partial [Planctomycetota bacterium]|nr:thiamine phosphate synthase [Planctomycetota bacterium]
MPRPAADRRAEALRRLLLVVVTDRGRCRGALVKSCEAAVRGGATAVLLRDLELPRGDRRRLARALRATTRAAGAALLVHSDAALARAVDADGVHLDSRADAAALSAARRAAGPGRLVGVSAHSRAEVLRAARGGADYAFVGPVSATPSHPGAPGIGWRAFAIAAEGARIPVLPIGGMDADAPPGRAAAIGAILGAPDPAKAAASMLRALAGPPPKRGPRPLLDERSLVGRFLRAIGRSPGLALGPGDDAVVLRDGGLAAATDMTVEGVHYR